MPAVIAQKPYLIPRCQPTFHVSAHHAHRDWQRFDHDGLPRIRSQKYSGRFPAARIIIYDYFNLVEKLLRASFAARFTHLSSPPQT